MGRVQGTPEIGTPNAGQQVNSYPQNFQTGGQTPYIGNPWNSGLFDCHIDPTNAVMTSIFPCVTFGQIAEVLDATEPAQGSQLTCPFGSFIYLLMMGACSQCIIGSKYRTRLRNRYGLVEAPYQDGMSHLFCPCCSLCQEYRELKSRQLDPALGWKGIVAQQQAMQYGNMQINQPPQPQAMSK
ncbi:hypothetical protein DH2020_041279 [Rehmannia glutinosa]|uniref:Uncharacterized protein n=1 Tax=Rehmannia glutinosa TaxID=99300 RepID=A0ABR0US83_REHGL